MSVRQDSETVVLLIGWQLTISKGMKKIVVVPGTLPFPLPSQLQLLYMLPPFSPTLFCSQIMTLSKFVVCTCS